jgi:hypothetical protein
MEVKSWRWYMIFYWVAERESPVFGINHNRRDQRFMSFSAAALQNTFSTESGRATAESEVLRLKAIRTLISFGALYSETNTGSVCRLTQSQNFAWSNAVMYPATPLYGGSQYMTEFGRILI